MIKLKSLISEYLDTEIHKIGYDIKDESSDMPINWNEPDIWDGVWTFEKIKQHAGVKNSFTAIYQAILDVNQLDPCFSEEEEELGYDWSEFNMKKNGFPPITVRRNIYGHVVMLDGNHRVKWAQEMGYKTIAAWVVDELLQKNIENND